MAVDAVGSQGPGQGHPALGLRESPFLRACRRTPVPHTPVWFMRQAGRSLPEYLKLREGVPMMEACARADMIVEITLQPVRRYAVDAAILFSDIVVPLKAIGVDLDIKPGVGPVIADPIRDASGLDVLRPLTPDDVPYVAEAAGELVRELGGTPLIGFAGAPFTLAAYLIEGGPSKNHDRTKAMMYGEAGAVGRADGAAGRHHHRVPEGADRGRGERGPALRLVGGRGLPGGLPRLGAALQPHGSSPRSSRSASRGSTSASAPASCSA